MNKLIILTYHNIVDKNKKLFLYDVNLQRFQAQMKQVSLLTHARIRPFDLMVTFDDGYSVWAREILDILNQYDLKAYFFICVKFLQQGKIYREDILKLRKAGMTIGSHSMTHRFMHTLPENEVFYEMHESKRILQDILQDEVKIFALPYGAGTPLILRVAKQTGYEHVFTSQVGVNDSLDFTLKRIALKRNTSIEKFKEITLGKGIRGLVVNQKTREFVKKIVGAERFYRMRNKMVRNAE